MRELRIEKITLNVGAGKDQEKVRKGIVLLEKITGRKPVKTLAKKRIPTWGIRPGLPIGCKVTVRGKEAEELLKRLLEAKEKITESNFDARGSVSFGLEEYMEIPGMKYDPDIGMMGLQVCVTLERPGFRIKRRKFKKKKIPKNHRITKQESIKFMEQYKGVEK